jgi:hypothetical protein
MHYVTNKIAMFLLCVMLFCCVSIATIVILCFALFPAAMEQRKNCGKKKVERTG